jgi:hypothetical protein
MKRPLQLAVFPSDSTFQRVLKKADAGSIEAIIQAWLAEALSNLLRQAVLLRTARHWTLTTLREVCGGTPKTTEVGK